MNTGWGGIKLKTNSGAHFINYSKLLTEGYTLLSGEEIGGFYKLQLSPQSENMPLAPKQDLMNRLTTTPYIDWNHRPELQNSNDDPKVFFARLVLRDKSNFHDLLSLIDEWGYSYKILQN